jgi:hypothetical protein
MELVRITVLLVGFSTVVALGIVGMGLDSCATSGKGAAIDAARRKVNVQVLMQLQLSPC